MGPTKPFELEDHVTHEGFDGTGGNGKSGYASLGVFVSIVEEGRNEVVLSGEATIPLYCPQKQKQGRLWYISKQCTYKGLAMVLGIISQDGGSTNLSFG